MAPLIRLSVTGASRWLGEGRVQLSADFFLTAGSRFDVDGDLLYFVCLCDLH